MNVHTLCFATPLGEMLAACDDGGRLLSLNFLRGRLVEEAERRALLPGDTLHRDSARCGAAPAQLGEYFRGERREFDLPLAPPGTPFQRMVWEELVRIPYGARVTYRELSVRVGRPGAFRAVGRANATNPVAIVVPCHRVVGSNGSLTGYAGGIDVKAALLALEGGAP